MRKPNVFAAGANDVYVTGLGKTAKMSADDLSFSNIQSALVAALGSDPDNDGDEDYPWIVDVYPGKSMFVYSCDGLTYEQGFALGEDGGVQLVGSPRQVRTVTSYEPVASFSRVDGDVAYYEGTIFEAGDYPDKGVYARPADLVALASGFSGVAPADIEHMPTAFDQALEGYGLEEVKPVEGGKSLWGRFAVPNWVREALGDKFKPSVTMRYDANGRPVSIDKIAIVGNPRVSSAQMQAAFSAAFAGARHSSSDVKAIQDAHDLLVGLGATCQPAAQMSGFRLPQRQAQARAPMAKEKPMNPTLKKVLALFGRKPEALLEAGITQAELDATVAEFSAPAPAAATIDPVVQAQLDSMKQQAEALFAKQAAQDAILLETRATEFADHIIKDEKKALPAERPGIIHAYKLAANADGNGVATFGVDGKVTEGENLKTVKALFENRKPLALFSSQLADGGTTDVDEATRLQNTRKFLTGGAIAAYGKRAK